MDLTFKYGDLKKVILESSNEFKAKLGPNVESDDKKNNGKAYDEAKKRAKDYDGGLSKEIGEDRPKYEKTDDNRTTLDYEIDNVTPEYKNRVKAQVHGYTSELEEKNDIEKTGDFEGNKNIYDGIKKSGQKIHKGRETAREIGLTARECPKETFKHGEMYESKDGFDMRKAIDEFKAKTAMPKSTLDENKNIKTIYFKKTSFLTEGHMISRIPDEFKKEGEQFKMRDRNNNEYIVEWKNNKANIISHINEGQIKQDFKKFKTLCEYTSKDTETTNAYRKNEGDATFTDMLNKVRGMK